MNIFVLGLFLYYTPIVLMIICRIATIIISGRTERYQIITNSRNITGAQAAETLLKSSSITDVRVVRTGGKVRDKYLPDTKKLNLNTLSYTKASIWAICSAALNTVRATHHHNSPKAFMLLKSVYFIIELTGLAGAFLVLSSIIFSVTSLDAVSPFLLFTGDALIILYFLLYLIKLPSELKKAHQALSLIKDNDLLNEEELVQAKKLLNDMALTS